LISSVTQQEKKFRHHAVDFEKNRKCALNGVLKGALLFGPAGGAQKTVWCLHQSARFFHNVDARIAKKWQ
jgi:hypothetical protein